MNLQKIDPYVLSLVFGVTQAVSIFVIEKLISKNTELRRQRKEANMKKESDHENLERARDALTLASSRKNIKDEMMEGLERGFVRLAEYQEIEEAYKAYTVLGGNGTLHHLHDDRWVNLKIVEDDYKDKEEK